jgi:hypothetical protein
MVNSKGAQKMTKTEKKIQDRLAMLSFYITKYSNLWSKSPRLYGWVHEYNTIQSNMPYDQWKSYCDKWQYAYSHNGYDFL